MDSDKKLEDATVSILTRAVSLDKASRYTESLVCYQEGLQLLMDSWKDMPVGRKKDLVKQKIEEYIGRAEQIKKLLKDKKESGTFHEEIVIKNGSKGHSYNSVMGRFLDGDVESVKVEDPYFRTYKQFCNLIHFCELVVSKCKNLKKINVITGPDVNNSKEQLLWFNSLQDDLKNNFNVDMVFEFSQTLHDRQILLSNGWIIKIGRGLDYFQSHTKHGLGTFDTDLRPCKETMVDIYYEKSTSSK